MQIRGKITRAEWSEVRKMLRSKWYWPRVVLGNWYGILLGGVLLWATAISLVSRNKVDWSALGLLWIIIGGILTLAFLSTTRAMTRLFKQVNAAQPEWVKLASDGVKLDGPQGATELHPWRSLSRWRGGHSVVLIDKSEDRGFIVLPISELSEMDKQNLRQFLDGRLPSR